MKESIQIYLQNHAKAEQKLLDMYQGYVKQAKDSKEFREEKLKIVSEIIEFYSDVEDAELELEFYRAEKLSIEDSIKFAEREISMWQEEFNKISSNLSEFNILLIRFEARFPENQNA